MSDSGHIDNASSNIRCNMTTIEGVSPGAWRPIERQAFVNESANEVIEILGQEVVCYSLPLFSTFLQFINLTFKFKELLRMQFRCVNLLFRDLLKSFLSVKKYFNQAFLVPLLFIGIFEQCFKH